MNGTNNYSSNKSMMTEAQKNALNTFKMETAREVGVTLKDGYNGDLTSRQAGSIGGQMVKKLVQQAESNLK
ncbi:MAG: alpha/beta-type small acid-soluble spore protein [Clostridia bacterium]|nr:alpha/beta-type small acid-soluble spore protein [Clostridia bacterium]